MYLLSYENGVVVPFPLTRAEDVAASAIARCEQVELGATVLEMTTYHIVGRVAWRGDRYVYMAARTH
jgi:hypothetical protein